MQYGYTEIEYVGKVLKMSQEKIRSVLDFAIPSICVGDYEILRVELRTD
jgi:hypothetical protein